LVGGEKEVVKEESLLNERKIQKVVINKTWSKQLVTNSYDFGTGVIFDSLDNLYLVGGTEIRSRLKPKLRWIGFLKKYNLSGDEIWNQKRESLSYFGEGVSVDSLDNIYVT
jgi:hypothetical protein